MTVRSQGTPASIAPETGAGRWSRCRAFLVGNLAEEAARCHAVNVIERQTGFLLELVIGFICVSVLAFRVPVTGGQPAANAPGRVEAVIAAIMAYVFYVSAALLADAEFPNFLRKHLFDGLVPAAVVGLLVNSLPRDSVRKALPWIPLPAMILALFYVEGALIFGLIAAAAVFSSENNNFELPVIVCALIGGVLFPVEYLVSAAGQPLDGGTWTRFKWWFKKRPKDAAVLDPRDAVQEGAVPEISESHPLCRPGRERGMITYARRLG